MAHHPTPVTPQGKDRENTACIVAGLAFIAAAIAAWFIFKRLDVVVGLGFVGVLCLIAPVGKWPPPAPPPPPAP
jgi:hypothetical protein